MTVWLRKIKVSESPRTFLKEVRNHDWQVQAGIVRTACCTPLMDDFSMTLTETYPNCLVDRATVLPKYLNDHSDFRLVGQSGGSVGRREGLSKHCPDCFSLHPKTLWKNISLMRHFDAFFVSTNFSYYYLLRRRKAISSVLCSELAVGRQSKKPFAKDPFAFLHAWSTLSFLRWWSSLLLVVNIAGTLLIPSTKCLSM